MRQKILIILGLVSFGVFIWALPTKVGDQPDAGAMLKGLNGWHVKSLFTIGDTLPSRDRESPDQTYRPVGVPDGIGAYSLNDTTLRVFVNHELVKQAGYEYQLRNGTRLTGARVSFFDISRDTLAIVNSGMAYDVLRDRQGTLVTEASQINQIGDSRFGLTGLCSSQLIQAGTYNFTDTIYFTGEEAPDPAAHPHGGTLWALDVHTQTMHAVPAAGRMSFENTAALQIDPDHIALLISDDTKPQSQEPDHFGQKAVQTTPVEQIISAPLWLYVGRINATLTDMKHMHLDVDRAPDQVFLNRNGLLVGELFYFVADNSIRRVSEFNGTAKMIPGTWKKISVRDVAQAGQPGYDASGYKNGFTLRREAQAGGAFQFSRPEDISTNPQDGTHAVFSSTGRDTVYPDDAWGTIYDIRVDTRKMTATLKILYDGDDQGGGQFSHPDDGIRSPDNLDWGRDGFIYIQEDNAKEARPFFGSHSQEEASIWRLDPQTGQVQRIAQIDRETVAATGLDPKTSLIGAWESSGILDVTHLLAGQDDEQVLLATVQAHSVKDPIIRESNLVESGQLVLLRNRPF